MTERSSARVTIGLPVYNGENLIGECLNNIAAQTYKDFIVLVYDNASTDRTGEIVCQFAEKDGRIIYHRNKENVGSAQNFLDVLAAAETDYFLWRADDDLSSENFLEQLIAELDANPGASLTAPRVRSERPAKSRVKETEFPHDWPGPRVINIIRKMFLSHPSWLYGMWRTDALRKYYHSTWEKYPIGWANDHLVLLEVILDEGVVGSNEACFVQRIGVRDGGSAQPATRDISEVIDGKRQMLNRYKLLCRSAVSGRDWGVFEGFVLRGLIGWYATRRVRSSEFRIFRLRVRRALGRRSA